MSKVKYNNDCCFNTGVECNKHECGLCGWNPVVSERRIKNIRADRQNKLKENK